MAVYATTNAVRGNVFVNPAVSSRRFGPLPADGVPAYPCPACRQAFVAGDYTTLVPLGPGTDPDQRKRAREGRAYNARAIMVHWACATGEVD